MFHVPKREPDKSPRVLHLREPKFGVSFDAPDDSWLAVGPRTSAMSVDWFWWYEERQIEVGVVPVGAIPDQAFDRLVDVIAESLRRKNGAITRKQSELGGKPCLHLVLDDAGATAVDAFVQRRGGFVYTLTVSAPARDTELLTKVRAGVRFDADFTP